MPILPKSITNQCQYVDPSTGERCEARRLRLGRSGYCPHHQEMQDHEDDEPNTFQRK